MEALEARRRPGMKRFRNFYNPFVSREMWLSRGRRHNEYKKGIIFRFFGKSSGMRHETAKVKTVSLWLIILERGGRNHPRLLPVVGAHWHKNKIESIMGSAK